MLYVPKLKFELSQNESFLKINRVEVEFLIKLSNIIRKMHLSTDMLKESIFCISPLQLP